MTWWLLTHTSSSEWQLPNLNGFPHIHVDLPLMHNSVYQKGRALNVFPPLTFVGCNGNQWRVFFGTRSSAWILKGDAGGHGWFSQYLSPWHWKIFIRLKSVMLMKSQPESSGIRSAFAKVFSTPPPTRKLSSIISKRRRWWCIPQRAVSSQEEQYLSTW